jgi:cellobiose-specific phosphotransferase system component IIA
MSSTRAEELRALADKYEAADLLATAASDAKTAYADALASGDEDQIAEARQRHREAAQALSDARSETRNGPMVAESAPGSATVRVGTVAGKVG